MKVFISQKMRGKSHEEILEDRELIKHKFKQSKLNKEEIEFIESYLPELEHKNPIEALSKSLSLLADADVALVPLESFYEVNSLSNCRNVRKHIKNNIKGCELETIIALAYGKEVIAYNLETIREEFCGVDYLKEM